MMEVMFKKKPAFIISLIVSPPELNTMALGGVATGSMKAQEAAIAAPANNGAVSISKEKLRVTNKGNTILAVAVFDVISVRKLIAAMIIKINKNTGRKRKS